VDFATKLGMLSSAPRGPAQRDRDAASGAAEPMVNVADGVGVTPGRADLALLVPERQTRFGALHLVQQLHPCTLRWCGQAVASLALGRE
jgi:hypothetical protein